MEDEAPNYKRGPGGEDPPPLQFNFFFNASSHGPDEVRIGNLGIRLG